MGYSAPRVKVDPFPRDLQYWEDEDPIRAARLKLALYAEEPKLETLATDYFGSVFRRLLLKLHKFFHPHIRRKGKVPPEGGWPSLDQLGPDAERHYQTVLGFFDEAIVELEQEESENQVGPTLQLPASPTVPEACLRSPLSPIFPPQSRGQPSPFSSTPASPTRKRKSEDEDEGSPRPKKSKNASKLPIPSPGSPASASRRRSRRSRTTRPSNLHISESYGDD